MTTEEFIKKIAPIVQKYAPQFGIKVVSPIIAQSILESQHGTSELAVKANNYFGIKYRPGRCPSGNGIYNKVGSEQDARTGQYVSSNMQWQKFPNMDACVKGYFEFTSLSNYKNLKGVTDPKKYLELIKADGYATSINYVPNLMNVIKKYNLTQYDVIKEEAKAQTEDTKYYRIQVGAFSKETNCDAMILKLKRNNITAIKKKYDNIWKAQVGCYKNLSNAEAMLEVVKKKGFNAFITYC